MRRAQLEQLLREVGSLTGRSELQMIGSQCIHAVTDKPPAEVLLSLECDLLFEPEDPAADVVDRELGVDSPFHVQHAIYVDTVPANFPYLPTGWEVRARVLDVGSTRVQCLSPVDLVMSKLAAGRLKDNEMVAAMFAHGLTDAETVRAEIWKVSDIHLRAVLLARLQIVLENVGR